MNKKELKAIAMRENYNPEDSLDTLEMLDTGLRRIREKHQCLLTETRDTIGERSSAEWGTIGVGFTASFFSFGTLLFFGLATGDVALLAWSGVSLVGIAGFGNAADMPNSQFAKLRKILTPKKYARRVHAYNQSIKAYSEAETAYRAECAPYIKAVEGLAKSFRQHFPDRDITINKDNEIEVVERNLTSIQKLKIEQKRMANNLPGVERADRKELTT